MDHQQFRLVLVVELFDNLVALLVLGVELLDEVAVVAGGGVQHFDLVLAAAFHQALAVHRGGLAARGDDHPLPAVLVDTVEVGVDLVDDGLDAWFEFSEFAAGDGLTDELPFLLGREAGELLFELLVEARLVDVPFHLVA